MKYELLIFEYKKYFRLDPIQIRVGTRHPDEKIRIPGSDLIGLDGTRSDSNPKIGSNSNPRTRSDSNPKIISDPNPPPVKLPIFVDEIHPQSILNII